MSLIHRKAAAEPKRKALEPQEHFCHILKKKITVAVEYPDYKNPLNKGVQGSMYCGNILPCYHNEVKCMYSGISPLFRNPFFPTDAEMAEDEATEPEPDEIFAIIPENQE